MCVKVSNAQQRDDDVLGGVVVRVADSVVDQSVKTELESMVCCAFFVFNLRHRSDCCVQWDHLEREPTAEEVAKLRGTA
jgi:hypothetical protein